jgi:hypothetical protein
MTTNDEYFGIVLETAAGKQTAAVTAILKRLTSIESKIDKLIKQETKNMATLDNLVAEVANQTSVDASVLTLIGGLVTQLQALANQATVDPAALQALVTSLKANDDKLALAVVANTPTVAAPAPVAPVVAPPA